MDKKLYVNGVKNKLFKMDKKIIFVLKCKMNQNKKKEKKSNNSLKQIKEYIITY